MIMKEYMDKMPETLKTKKEIDEYYKISMKKSIENSKKNTDDNPKKDLTKYQKFIKDNSKIVKQQNPDLTGPQVFSMIAQMWKKQKETILTNDEIEDKNENNIDEIEEVKEDVKEEIEVDVKEVKEDVKKKKEKVKK
jgi:hypothetical protein